MIELRGWEERGRAEEEEAFLDLGLDAGERSLFVAFGFGGFFGPPPVFPGAGRWRDPCFSVGGLTL